MRSSSGFAASGGVTAERQKSSLLDTNHLDPSSLVAPQFPVEMATTPPALRIREAVVRFLSGREFPPPLRVCFLDPPRRDGRGNAVILVEWENSARVLKVYRPKMGRTMEVLSNLYARGVQKRRGYDAAARADTEKVCIDLWKHNGFDVFSPIDEPLPPDLGAPALWLNYYPGRRLSDVLVDPLASKESGKDLIHRASADIGARHELALDQNDCLFVHYNGAAKHLIVHEDRLISFDFEVAFVSGFSVREAIVREVGSFVRSLDRSTTVTFGEALEEFIAGYGRKARLREITRWATEGFDPYRLVTRTADWFKPKDQKKGYRLSILRRELG